MKCLPMYKKIVCELTSSLRRHRYRTSHSGSYLCSSMSRNKTCSSCNEKTDSLPCALNTSRMTDLPYASSIQKSETENSDVEGLRQGFLDKLNSLLSQLGFIPDGTEFMIIPEQEGLKRSSNDVSVSFNTRKSSTPSNDFRRASVNGIEEEYEYIILMINYLQHSTPYNNANNYINCIRS